jgi:lipopolysaccharide transport system ATP-binding protein
MAREDVVIKLEGVSKKYKLYNNKIERMKEALHPLKKKYHRDFYALKNFDLEVRKGEILGIVGRNGSGKSTLLKLIAGVITPSSGSIQTKGSIVPLLELGSGFNPEFTGMDNIYFYSSLLGYEKENIQEKVDEILGFAEIGDHIGQPLKTYSSGMKARLAFAVSVNVDPDILILDEVLSVGDELFRRKSYAKMEEFFRSGKTILFVSHTTNVINELCSRAIMIDKGEQILEGLPKFVTMHYQKYIFTKPDKADEVRNQILLINKDDMLKKELSMSIENNTKGGKSNKEDKILNNEVISDQIVDANKTKSYFMPDFIPTSTVITKNYEVYIQEIYIRTKSGDKVNALEMNNEFELCCLVRFDIEVEKVNFSMAIRTEKGLLVSGFYAPGENEYIENISKGHLYEVRWKFFSNLIPANYYVNIGVRSYKSEMPVILCRVVDAYVFKIIADKLYHVYGIVYLNHQARVRRIDPSEYMNS